ncbi:hypothetical protein LC593_13730 [Nostoc sp. CHAB 5844]|nr:hypothetical protein [Nostoc sp. CHAB 5844]
MHTPRSTKGDRFWDKVSLSLGVVRATINKLKMQKTSNIIPTSWISESATGCCADSLLIGIHLHFTLSIPSG